MNTETPRTDEARGNVRTTIAGDVLFEYRRDGAFVQEGDCAALERENNELRRQVEDEKQTAHVCILELQKLTKSGPGKALRESQAREAAYRAACTSSIAGWMNAKDLAEAAPDVVPRVDVEPVMTALEIVNSDAHCMNSVWALKHGGQGLHDGIVNIRKVVGETLATFRAKYPKEGTAPDCNTCCGTGQVEIQNGPYERKCDKCGGTGKGEG